MSDDDAARADYEERSWRELEAGRLPLRAQERLAAMEADHAFTSDLSAAEHLAVRGVGFEPVGQVLGASVFQIGYTGSWDCGVTGYGVRGGGYGQWGNQWGGSAGTWWGGGGPQVGGGWNSGGFSGYGTGGPTPTGGSWTGRLQSGGWVQGPYGWTYGNLSCDTVTVHPWRAALLQAQKLAMSRMEQEARALGGDGVVAVRFHETPLPNGAVEFHVIGTAVRGPQAKRSREVFSSALSGQDFARLLHAGWMPVRLLFGVACMTRHDDVQTRWNSLSWANVELGGYTKLVLDTRGEARMQMARAAASAGAQAAVLSDTYEAVSEHECFLVEGGHDHVVRTTFVGTGIVRFTDRPRDPAAGALPILRLDRNRYTDARADKNVGMP